MATQITLIQIAGLLHFGILLASALVPRVLDWRKQLQKLSALSRHVVWVHGMFIVLVIIGFGAVSTFAANELATGDKLARLVCGLIAVFWTSRLVIQLFLFDPRPYLCTTGLKLGYHGLTAVFSYFGFVYTGAAVFPAGP